MAIFCFGNACLFSFSPSVWQRMLPKPSFFFKIQSVTLVLSGTVLLTPIVLTVLLVVAIDFTIDEHIPKWQMAASERVSSTVVSTVFSPVLMTSRFCRSAILSPHLCLNAVELDFSASLSYDEQVFHLEISGQFRNASSLNWVAISFSNFSATLDEIGNDAPLVLQPALVVLKNRKCSPIVVGSVINYSEDFNVTKVAVQAVTMERCSFISTNQVSELTLTGTLTSANVNVSQLGDTLRNDLISDFLVSHPNEAAVGIVDTQHNVVLDCVAPDARVYSSLIKTSDMWPRACLALSSIVDEQSQFVADNGVSLQEVWNSFYVTTIPLKFAEANVSLSHWRVVHFLPTSSYLSKLLQTRGKIIVAAFAIASFATTLMLVMMRSLQQPIQVLSHAIRCCAVLDLEAIEIMEASSVSEIAHIQRCVAYLAIRLYHYLRFLPDREVFRNLQEEEEEDFNATTRTYRFDGRDVSNDAPMLRLPEDDSEIDETESQTEADSAQEEIVHKIQVSIVYESRHAERNVESRRKIINKSASFVFYHRASDPVHSMLIRECRRQLNERPGEVLVLFVQTQDGRRQLNSDSDVLFAIEFFSSHGDEPVLCLTVRKGSVRSVMPILIALGTLASFCSRLLLAISRASAVDNQVQLLGVLLLSCLGMQIAQNTLISLYLIRRFTHLDLEFRAWKDVSKKEMIFGLIFGALNVTNLEVLSSHIRFGKSFRLSAPLHILLLQKIRKWSFVGFIVGDFVPLVIIIIETVLRQLYQDPFVLLSTFFSILSVASILVRHGIIRFVIDDVIHSNSLESAANQGCRSLMLSRKQMTVLRIAVSNEAALMSFLSPILADALCERLYSAVEPLVRKFGGILLSTKALTMTIGFNVHAVIPNHAGVAYKCFVTVQHAVEVEVLLPFFEHVSFRQFLTQHLAESYGSPDGKVQFREGSMFTPIFHSNHRVIGSIVTGEMYVGYIGTLSSQTLQQMCNYWALSDGLCALNDLYGSTLLANGNAVRTADLAHLVCRRIDRVDLGRALVSGKPTKEDLEKDHNKIADLKKHVHDVYEIVLRDFSLAPRRVRARNRRGIFESEDVREYHTSRLACELSTATIESVRKFDAAMDFLLSVSTSTSVSNYVRNHAFDIVAVCVLCWAKFFGASNEHQCVLFPRLITELGVARHHCEQLKGASDKPIFKKDTATEELSKICSARGEREKLFRPPRSERRMKDPRTRPTDLPVLEQVMGLKEFSVSFSSKIPASQ